MKPTDLRKKISDFGIDIGKKARTVKDKTAEEVIQKISEEREASSKEQEKEHKKTSEAQSAEALAKAEEETLEKPKIEIPEVLTVKDFSARINQPVTEVIKTLMKNGVMATINENIDFETASIIGEEFGLEIVKEAEKQSSAVTKMIEAEENEPQEIKNRPPVITVMGHVDHGKTSLLDKIRSADVVSGESGGITQHIGAYKVNIKTKEGKTRQITFLDTPGHEAFTAMRAHGAKITDIAVLVVAADDGVKPQTKEAIDHAKAAGVPIIIAINKMDKPTADPGKVKKELASYNLATEDWGGSTPAVEVSAHSGKGIPELLDMILLVADLAELKTNYAGKARGVVIESHKDTQAGPVATILIQKGILSKNDAVICGKTYGKIKRMLDQNGKEIDTAYPSDPVKLLGCSEVPNFGELLVQVDSEKEARNLVQKVEKESVGKAIGISEVAQGVREGKIKELNVILKADVAGSIEAIRDSLEAIGAGEVKVKIIRAAVGDITEADIMMAQASSALVIGFRVGTAPAAKKIADHAKVKISNYDVIYQLIDDIYAAASGLLEPEIVETEIGKLKVLAIFTRGKKKQIIGGEVTEGIIEKDLKAQIYREGEKIGEGKIANLEHNKKAVSNVESGAQCGLELETEVEIAEGDKLLVTKTEEILRKITK